jgi:hypothetical protein
MRSNWPRVQFAPALSGLRPSPSASTLSVSQAVWMFGWGSPEGTIDPHAASFDRHHDAPEGLARRRCSGARAVDSVGLRAPAKARPSVRPQGVAGRSARCDVAGAPGVRSTGRCPHRGLEGSRAFLCRVVHHHAADSGRRGGGRHRVEHSTAINFDTFPAAETDRAAKLARSMMP